MTSVDPYARPDLPDPGPRTPEHPGGAPLNGDGSTTYDFFTPPPERFPGPAVTPGLAVPPGPAPAAYPAPTAMAPPLQPLPPPAHAPHDPPTLELGPPVAAVPGTRPDLYGHGGPGHVHGHGHPPTLVEPLGYPPHESQEAYEGEEPVGPLYVIGDIHGYLQELLDGLHSEGLIDDEGHWAAGRARVWFLGDFTDRGPDGIGVIDLVMRLSAEAAAAGGYCKALMGNHELLLIGAKRFGDTPVNSGAGTATFQAAWLLNGGQRADMERLEDVHLQWMSRLDAATLADGHLLLHSDTTAYLDYGDSIEDVNDTIHELINRNDADTTWDLFRKFTKRFAFRDEETGPQAVRRLLTTYGGNRIVHGHSPIPYLLGEVGTEDGDEAHGPEAVDGPHVYADGLAIAMDGGVTMAGKLLVQQLPLRD
jgi:hypothetical protein